MGDLFDPVWMKLQFDEAMRPIRSALMRIAGAVLFGIPRRRGLLIGIAPLLDEGAVANARPPVIGRRCLGVKRADVLVSPVPGEDCLSEAMIQLAREADRR